MIEAQEDVAGTVGVRSPRHLPHRDLDGVALISELTG
jgi:hypothetical protein